MLYSPLHSIAFAHYPKTAGHSMVKWFRSTFPDATFVKPDPIHPVSHLSVRESLDHLGLAPQSFRFLGRSGRNAVGSLTRQILRFPRPRLRIIGVVREPLSMLVSLFEYWKSYDFGTEPITPLIAAAKTGSFPTFLHRAVVRRELPKYDNFFDVGGRAWENTRLLDLESLDDSLATLTKEWGIDTPVPRLERCNIGPRQVRDLSPYIDEAGALATAARSYFGWYYARHGAPRRASRVRAAV
jgi:hypothetical protein